MEKERIKHKKVNKCYCCHRATMLFIWSSSAVFDRDSRQKLSNLMAYKDGAQISDKINLNVLNGVPVCFECIEKLKKGGRITSYA